MAENQRRNDERNDKRIDERMTDDPALHVLTTALQHYAKGVAHATLRNFADGP